MHFVSLRPAIAMIELIFAIVVMGIVIMSAPMLISTAGQTSVVAMKQESIDEALSEMNIILTYAWDENDTNGSCVPPVLRVSNGDSELDQNTSTHRRVGVENNSTAHTFLCGTQELNASLTLGGDANDGATKDDMDDFGGTGLTLINRGNGGKDYLDTTTVNVATAVQYVEDNTTYSTQTITYNIPVANMPANQSSNIKQLTVTLTSNPGGGDTSLDSNITLKAFSCNVGGFFYAHRTM